LFFFANSKKDHILAIVTIILAR